MTKSEVEVQIEEFRQLVVESRGDSTVEKKSLKCAARLNDSFQSNRRLFSPEDVRWLNVLRGYLGNRLEAHKPPQVHTPQSKRKGDTLTCCWRCQTPIDERFVEYCVACSSAEYQWRVCPVCRACGCQSTGRVLM